MTQFYNPAIPFSASIPGGMHSGKTIKIHGSVPSTAQRFEVNLLSGSNREIALHVNPRFDEQQVVRNTLHKNSWGHEERHGSMPLQRGQTFDLHILCDSHHFKIAFNGVHFADYNHRVFYGSITNFAIEGQVSIHSIHFDERGASSGGYSPPLNAPIPGGMHPGKMITIHGNIPPTADRFAVNLRCGSVGEIALHVNPRFNEKQVVRNTFRINNWGREERHGPMPVQRGQKFDIAILCDALHFKIAFNGRHFADYNHRIPYASVTNFEINGEVLIYSIQFDEQGASNGCYTIPLNAPIPGGMHPGKIITIQGNILPTADRFAVNLISGLMGEIALHINPRFNEQQVVRNTFQNNHWGHEERHGSMPLVRGQTFDIIILCNSLHFKIAFNGQHFAEYSHRMPITSITNLGVSGDVQIHSIRFDGQGASDGGYM